MPTVCHESTKGFYTQKCGAAQEMRVGPSESALFVQVYSGNVNCTINLFFAFPFPSAFAMVIVSKVDIITIIATVKNLAAIITTVQILAAFQGMELL